MDPTTFFGQPEANGSAASPTPSADAGDQAQPAVTQGVAGAPGAEVAGQPPAHDANAQPQESGSSQAETPTPAQPQIDPSEVERMRQQLQSYEGTFQKIQGWAQQQEAQRVQQQIQQRYNERVKNARDTAESMSPREAIDYMARQMESINGEWMQNMQAFEQNFNNRLEQERRALGTPLWVKELVRQHNLPSDAEEDLLALGDPRLIEQNLPRVKKRYEDNRALQERLDQMARSMQANQMVQNGAGVVGGTTAPPTPNIPADADPDTKAMMIYQQLQRNAGVIP